MNDKETIITGADMGQFEVDNSLHFHVEQLSRKQGLRTNQYLY